MRLWSLHPRCLDAKGLVALWREALLAQSVLLGLTQGYRNHPQLDRFKAAEDPAKAIGAYLQEVFRESCARGYCFTEGKIVSPGPHSSLTVTTGQVEFEWGHLLRKLAERDPERHRRLRRAEPEIHPLFRRVAGGIADWER